MLKTVEQMSKVSGIGENKLRELMDSGELEYIPGRIIWIGCLNGAGNYIKCVIFHNRTPPKSL